MKKHYYNITTTKGIFPIKSVLPNIRSLPNKKKRKNRGRHNKFNFIGYSIKIDTLKLRVFKRSLHCPICGIKGNIFLLEVDKKNKTPRLSLYHKQKNGKLILMTVDHIKPKSKGGSDNLKNLQTMCEPCNQKKGNEYKENA